MEDGEPLARIGITETRRAESADITRHPIGPLHFILAIGMLILHKRANMSVSEGAGPIICELMSCAHCWEDPPGKSLIGRSKVFCLPGPGFAVRQTTPATSYYLSQTSTSQRISNNLLKRMPL
jgi:hypothetical protein